MVEEKSWGLKVTPKDDGLHPSDVPECWEWWYFDADFDNGYNMIGTFHFGSPRPPAYPYYENNNFYLFCFLQQAVHVKTISRPRRRINIRQ